MVTSSLPNAERVVQFFRPPRPQRSDPNGRVVDAERVARALEELLEALGSQLSVQVQVGETATSVALAPVAPEQQLIAGPSLLSLPGLSVDLRSRTVLVDDVPVTLTRLEFDLLAFLLQRRGAALSRAEMMRAVWQSGYSREHRTIDVHIRRIRMKIGRHADRLTTVRGVGYRLE